MEQKAQLNYLKIAPRKVRALASVIRGLSVNEAEAQLLMQKQRSAKPLLKLLRSAVSDAKNRKNIDVDKLYVKNMKVDQGPMLKRTLPRARGMATLIQKKTSHITLVLAENPKLAAPRFKITVPKKVKLPGGEARKTKKKKQPEREEVETPPVKPKKPGFFKRVFSRKAGM